MTEESTILVAMSRPATLASLDLSTALASLTTRDPALGRAIAVLGPFSLAPGYATPPYQRLLSAIVYQQLSGKAAATILSRLLAIYGAGRFPTPAEVLRTPIERLHRAGLSRAKTLAIRDLADRTLDGTVPTLAQARRIPDEELIERLVAVRGVGRWTAQMFLIGGLGRPDVLPADDLGVRKGFQRVYRTRRLPEPARIMKQGRYWAPYRSIASWYFWRVVDEGA
jgi:DNA-3-methyladenine glycosylase II